MLDQDLMNNQKSIFGAYQNNSYIKSNLSISKKILMVAYITDKK